MNSKDENCGVMGVQNNKSSEWQKQQNSQAALWAKALYELRERKLDQVALAATKTSCKFCKSIDHVSPRLDPKELENDQDLTELNYWNPRTKNKTTQFPSESIIRDVATSVQTGLTIVKSIIRKSISENVMDNDTKEDNANVDVPPFIQISSRSDESVVHSLHFLVSSGKDNTNFVDGSTVPPQATSSDKIEKDDSSKGLKSTGLRKYSQKASDEHIDKRKVSILGGVHANVSSRSAVRSEDVRSSIKSGASIASSLKDKPMQRTESKAISFGSLPSIPKRISSVDVAVDTNMKRETSGIPPIGGTEFQRSKKSSLKSLSLPKQELLQSSNEEVNKAERDTIREFRRMSERIGETIALSKLREKEIIEREQEANLLNTGRSFSSVDSKGSKRNLKDESRKSIKSDSFPRKQISFYGEAFPKKTSSSKMSRENSSRTSNLKNLEALAQRKKMVEDEMRKSHILEEDKKMDSDIHLCPCFQTMKEGDRMECICTKGICITPDEDDVKKIEEFLKQLSQTKKPTLKCFAKALVKIKRIMKTNLDQATADHQILDVLTGLDPCECEGGPCECQIHHIDLDAMNADHNFMAAIMLEQFNKMLDEKLQNKLGIKLKETPTLRNRSMETEESFESTSSVSEKIECNICKDQDCTCVTK